MKLNFWEIYAKTADNEEKVHLICLYELKQQITDVPNFISIIITGGESWVDGYHPESKYQSSQ